MSEERLLTLTIEEVREFMHNLPKSGGKQIELGSERPRVNENNPERIAELNRFKMIAKSKGIIMKEFNSLINKSYDVDTIEAMSAEEIHKIFPQTTIRAVTDLQTWEGDIPYLGNPGGDYEQYSMLAAPTSEFELQNWCDMAKTYAEYVLNRTYNNSSIYTGQNIRFTYYLWGEYDSDIDGVHEGVDIHDANDLNRSIRSAHIGKVHDAVGGTYGIVRVYDEILGITFTYMHMNTANNNLSDGDNVAVGTYLGDQDKKGALGL